MADNSRSKAGMDGWGNHIAELVNIPVVNRAIGGRSARSYTREKRFDEAAKLVAAGDWVVIEFGHNDGGSVSPSNDNGRTDCPGAGKQTCAVNFQGETTAKTFPAYMIEAGRLFTAKGAQVIMSSQTPNNPWERGEYRYSAGRFTDYVRDAAKEVGAGAFFIDHGTYTAKAFEAYGSKTTTELFMTGDHTHTTVKGAQVVAKAFAKAVVCSKIPLAQHVKNVSC